MEISSLSLPITIMLGRSGFIIWSVSIVKSHKILREPSLALSLAVVEDSFRLLRAHFFNDIPLESLFQSNRIVSHSLFVHTCDIHLKHGCLLPRFFHKSNHLSSQAILVVWSRNWPRNAFFFQYQFSNFFSLPESPFIFPPSCMNINSLSCYQQLFFTLNYM